MDQSWGNLSIDKWEAPKWKDVKAVKDAAAAAEAAKTAVKKAIVVVSTLENAQSVEEENEEMLEGYTVPDLKLRMDICKHFPIVIKKCPDGKFALEWHRDQYDCFHQLTATSSDSHAAFDYYCVWRLIYAIRQKHRIYKIEPPRSKHIICVISMEPAHKSEAVVRSTKEFMLSRGVNIPDVSEFPSCKALITPPYPKAAPKEREGPVANVPPAHANVPHANVPPANTPPFPNNNNNVTRTNNKKRNNNTRKAHQKRQAQFAELQHIEERFPVNIYYEKERGYQLVEINDRRLREEAYYHKTPLSTYEHDMVKRLLVALKSSSAWKMFEPRGSNERYVAVLRLL